MELANFRDGLTLKVWFFLSPVSVQVTFKPVMKAEICNTTKYSQRKQGHDNDLDNMICNSACPVLLLAGGSLSVFMSGFKCILAKPVAVKLVLISYKLAGKLTLSLD